MNRYNNIQQLKTDNGKRYYKTVFYPEIPLSENDIYVITTQGDRLDLLANQFYKDSTLYWIIASANPEITLGSLFLPFGVQLRIPINISSIVSSYNVLNSL